MNSASVSADVALVLGGTRGIGCAVSVALARQRVKTIVANYVQNDTAATECKRQVEAAGAACILEKANLAFPAEIESLFERVSARFQRIDHMVHCAALGAFKPLADVRPNQWDLSLAVNARSFLICVQKCLPLMPEGRIVAISSLGSRRAVPYYGAIGVSKAALEATIRQLAMELGPRGIRINGVVGGFIATDSISHFPKYEEMMTRVVEHTPFGRTGQPEDIADVVTFLVSSQARWIQGQTIVADGGFGLS